VLATSSARRRSEVSRDRRKRFLHITMNRVERASGRDVARHAHELNSRGKGFPVRPVRFAKPAARPIATNRPAHLMADRKTNPAGAVPSPPEHHERRPVHAPSPLKHCLELFAPCEPLAPRKPHRLRTVQRAYTAMRLRPFARRRLRTFRPPGVVIRARNPCVRFRFRRFG